MMSRVVSLLGLAALGGCASSLSGVGGSEGYACKAPIGAQCTSVSGVYANSTQGQGSFPGLVGRMSPIAAYSSIAERPAPAARQATVGAIRSAPRVLRVWVAPWEDRDGDLHEEAVVHVLADTGRWLIEHMRPARHSHQDGAMPPLAPAEASALVAPGPLSPEPARFPIQASAHPTPAANLPGMSNGAAIDASSAAR